MTILSSSLRALVYLRSAFLAADMHDRPFITMALKDLLAAPSLHERRDECLVTLKKGLDAEHANDLLNAIWPLPWRKTP